MNGNATVAGAVPAPTPTPGIQPVIDENSARIANINEQVQLIYDRLFGAAPHEAIPESHGPGVECTVVTQREMLGNLLGFVTTIADRIGV